MARTHSASDYKFKTRSDGYVHVHPSSVCHSASSFDSPYLVFHEKVKTSKVFIREMSMVPVYPMILFGGTGKHKLDVVCNKLTLKITGYLLRRLIYTHFSKTLQHFGPFIRRL